MNAKFLHPAGHPRVASEDHGGQHACAARPISRACCCPAYVFVLPGCPGDAMLRDDRVRAPSAPLSVTGGA